jgi:hypothetical protein
MAKTPDEFDFTEILNQYFPKVQDAIRNLSSVVTRDNPIRPTKSNADPFSTTATSRQDLSKSNNVFLGIVAEVLPFWGWYKVISYNGGYAIPCNLISDCSQTPMGARRIGSIQPHTKVHFIKPSSGSHGTIIGVEPEVMPNVSDVLPDFIRSSVPRRFLQRLADRLYISRGEGLGMRDRHIRIYRSIYGLCQSRRELRVLGFSHGSAG